MACECNESCKSCFSIWHYINVLLLLSITGLGVYYWGRLPDNMPVHFGLDGTPDRWSSRGGEFLLIFIVPWGLTAFMYLISLLAGAARKNPQFMNIPNKEKFLKLSSAEQEPFFEALKALFYSTAAAVNLLFLLIAYGMTQVAMGVYDRLPVWCIWPCLGIVLAFAIGNTIRLMRISYRITK